MTQLYIYIYVYLLCELLNYQYLKDTLPKNVNQDDFHGGMPVFVKWLMLIDDEVRKLFFSVF